MRSLEENKYRVEARSHEMQQQLNERMHDANELLHGKSNNAMRVLKHQRPPDGKSDYTDIPFRQRTLVQKIAGLTFGIIAPAMPVTAAGHYEGVKAVTSIVRGDYVNAAKQAFKARFPDMFDGLLADITKTKSPTGAVFDAGGDNIIMAGLVTSLAYQGKIPPDIAGTLLRQRAQTVYENTRIRAAGDDTNPTWIAKQAMLRASLYVGGTLKCEAALQEGHAMRAGMYSVATAIMGELAISKGNEALADYHQRRVALETVGVTEPVSQSS